VNIQQNEDEHDEGYAKYMVWVIQILQEDVGLGGEELNVIY
jgi:hypothetical protein